MKGVVNVKIFVVLFIGYTLRVLDLVRLIVILIALRTRIYRPLRLVTGCTL